MTQFKIGNWLITGDGIKWDGQPNVDYLITKEKLVELGTGERSKMYNWLVHMAEKTWATEADIYALNSAFIYAIEYFELDFKTGSFVSTLIEQQKEISSK